MPAEPVQVVFGPVTRSSCWIDAMRRATGAAAVLLVTVGIVGCTPSQPREETPTSTVTPSPEGIGTADCAAARQAQAEPSSSDDLIFGPLRYAGLAPGYRTVDGRPNDPGPDGLTFYKIGAEMSAGAEATVGIGESARGYAGIVVENGRDGGYSQVTYRSCADLPPDTMNWWVGGFVLRGRDSACVPLDIAVPGERVAHFDLAIPVGACD